MKCFTVNKRIHWLHGRLLILILLGNCIDGEDILVNADEGANSESRSIESENEPKTLQPQQRDFPDQDINFQNSFSDNDKIRIPEFGRKIAKTIDNHIDITLLVPQKKNQILGNKVEKNLKNVRNNTFKAKSDDKMSSPSWPEQAKKLFNKNRYDIRYDRSSPIKRKVNTTADFYLTENSNSDAQFVPVPKRIYIRHKGSANKANEPDIFFRPIHVRKNRRPNKSLKPMKENRETSSTEFSHLKTTGTALHPINSHSQIPRSKKSAKKYAKQNSNLGMKRRRKRLFKMKRKQDDVPNEMQLATFGNNERENLDMDTGKSQKEPHSFHVENLNDSAEGNKSDDPKDSPKDLMVPKIHHHVDYYSVLFGEHEEVQNSRESSEREDWKKPLHRLFGPPYDHYRGSYYSNHNHHSHTHENKVQQNSFLIPPESVFEHSAFSFSTPSPHVRSHHSHSLITTSHSLKSPFQSLTPIIPFIPDYNPSGELHHSTSHRDSHPSIYVKAVTENSLSNSVIISEESLKNGVPEEPFFDTDLNPPQNVHTEIVNEKEHRVTSVGKSISHHHVWNRRKQKEYPVYHSIPDTSFSCSGRPAGMYADLEADCQVWHICESDSRHHSFLCPNGTAFSQLLLTCDWWYNVKCEDSEQFLSIGPSAEVFKNTFSSNEIDSPVVKIDPISQVNNFGGKTLQRSSRGRMRSEAFQSLPSTSSEKKSEEHLFSDKIKDEESHSNNEIQLIKKKEIEDSGIENELNFNDENENKNGEEEDKIEEKTEINQPKNSEEYDYPDTESLLIPEIATPTPFPTPIFQDKPKLTPKFVEFIPYEGNSYPLFRLLTTRETNRFVNEEHSPWKNYVTNVEGGKI